MADMKPLSTLLLMLLVALLTTCGGGDGDAGSPTDGEASETTAVEDSNGTDGTSEDETADTANGDGASEDETTDTTTGDSEESSDSGGAAIDQPAAAGEAIVEFGDQSFTATITECTISDDGFSFETDFEEHMISLTAIFFGDGEWSTTVQVVTLDGLYQHAGTAVTPAIDGRSIEIDLEVVTPANETVDGQLRATCP